MIENNSDKITLMGIECEGCKISFFSNYKTGDHICPKCGSKNERYLIDEDFSEAEIKFIEECFIDIKKFLTEKYEIKEFPNTATMDFLVNLTKKLRNV